MYFRLHGKIPIPVAHHANVVFVDITGLPKWRANNNIIPEFKIKLNVIEVLIQIVATEQVLTLTECS
jgi:hypothetical protein